MRRWHLAAVIAITAAVLVSVHTSLPPLLARQATPAAVPGGAAAEVERVERDLVAAIGRTDLATYDRIVADDYVAYTDAGEELKKPEIMASYRAGTRQYQALAISDVKVRVFGDTAILSARTSGTRVEPGKAPVANNVRYFRVYTRRSGVWRAVMQMVTPLPAD